MTIFVLDISWYSKITKNMITDFLQIIHEKIPTRYFHMILSLRSTNKQYRSQSIQPELRQN